MDKSENTSCTPVSSVRKSLGIRRSIAKSEVYNTPLSRSIKKINFSLHSKEKIDINSLDQNNSESPKTPIVTGAIKSLRLGSRGTKSTTSNSYKTSLSRTFTQQKNKKKKLNFSPLRISNSEEASLGQASLGSSNDSSPLRALPQSPLRNNSNLLIGNEPSASDLKSLDCYELMNEEELRNEIDKKTKILSDIKKHEEKVKELKTVIEMWEKGFQASFANLREKLNSQSDVILLQQLKLPQELLKYC